MNQLGNNKPTSDRAEAKMINEQTWHRDIESQKRFVWTVTSDGIELDHCAGKPSYTIPWSVFNSVLSYARNQAHQNNNVVTAGTSMTNPTPGSIGAWVQIQNFSILTGTLTSRHLSFLGPICGRMGFISRQLNGNSIQWVFI